MKIASRRTPFGDRLCFPEVVPRQLIDIQAAFVRRSQTEGVHRDDALARARRALSGDLPALLQADPELTAVRRVFDWAVDHAGTGDLDEDCLWSDEPGRLGPPIGRPRTIWCMLANFPRERPGAVGAVTSDTAPQRTVRGPQGCLKAISALAGPHDDLRYPAISEKVDPEMELAVVIGPRSRHLTPETAMGAVAGYVGFCDIGSRDVSERDNNRMDRGKGFDTYGITGPWFVTADEIADPHRLSIRSWVNGELRQDGSTAEMFHSIPDQLVWLTEALTLAPGDVLSTGTPLGHPLVRPGDVVRGEIEGLGTVENRVVLDK
ncbi:fumarylacetoacetate hydrolase family protein [Streptomyces sp. NBC_01506]|uniref:fumarylacetoacetate hydrolase family protein n=1 Tax=Streptomyces sp. NBC_01506 TaxID=2903887 RepID=UPI003870DFA1